MTISLTHLDDFIRSKGLLTHYFYAQKWNTGELTKDELALYAKEYFHLARNIPSIVATVRERASERRPALLAAIEENIVEETEHVELWKRFASSLGVSEEELITHEPHALTREGVLELRALAASSLEDGVTAMYAMELTLPEIARSKKDGLVAFYGLYSADAHVYFDEHLKEEEHFGVWRNVEVDPVKAMHVAKKSLASQHKVLDGVCGACGFSMHC